MSGLQFGTTTGGELGDVAALESMGLDSLWVGGHITGPHPIPELMMNLARLAVTSTSATVGAAALVLPLYQPAVIAKQIAQLDQLTGGRLVLGVGAGGDYPEEYRAVDVPMEHRGARLAEGVELLRKFWSAEEVVHKGRFYNVDGARIHPAPLQGTALPVVMAGRKKAIRRAATVADGWMPYFYSVRAYAESVQQITAIAAESGRDLSNYHWYHYTFVALDDDEEGTRSRAAARLGAGFRGDPNQDYGRIVDGVVAAGNDATVTKRLQDYVDAGVRHFIFLPMADEAEKLPMLERLLEKVTPNLVVPSP